MKDSKLTPEQQNEKWRIDRERTALAYMADHKVQPDRFITPEKARQQAREHNDRIREKRLEFASTYNLKNVLHFIWEQIDNVSRSGRFQVALDLTQDQRDLVSYLEDISVLKEYMGAEGYTINHEGFSTSWDWVVRW